MCTLQSMDRVGVRRMSSRKQRRWQSKHSAIRKFQTTQIVSADRAAIDKLKSIITDREYTSSTDEAKERIAREFFADIPSSDSVEVVRCKDCKHYAGEGMYCACDIMVHYDNFYCYWGEREEA